MRSESRRRRSDTGLNMGRQRRVGEDHATAYMIQERSIHQPDKIIVKDCGSQKQSDRTVEKADTKIDEGTRKTVLYHISILPL